MSKNRNIFILWLIWHFFEMPLFLMQAWKNYIMFALNYFSVPIVLKSLFAPWRKYVWSYPRGFDIGEFFNTLLSNIFSRFLGALMRVFLIIAGIMFQIFVIFAGLIIFILWILVPFIAIAGFLFVIFY